MDLLLPQFGLISWILFSILIIVLPVAALIRVFKDESTTGNAKVVWTLVILLLPVLGPVLYFAIGSSRKPKRSLN